MCAVKWSGARFLSGSMDSTVVCWDEQGNVTQRFAHHKGPVMDIDWLSETVHALRALLSHFRQPPEKAFLFVLWVRQKILWCLADFCELFDGSQGDGL